MWIWLLSSKNNERLIFSVLFAPAHTIRYNHMICHMICCQLWKQPIRSFENSTAGHRNYNHQSRRLTVNNIQTWICAFCWLFSVSYAVMQQSCKGEMICLEGWNIQAKGVIIDRGLFLRTDGAQLWFHSFLMLSLSCDAVRSLTALFFPSYFMFQSLAPNISPVWSTKLLTQ